MSVRISSFLSKQSSAVSTNVGDILTSLAYSGSAVECTTRSTMSRSSYVKFLVSSSINDLIISLLFTVHELWL